MNDPPVTELSVNNVIEFFAQVHISPLIPVELLVLGMIVLLFAVARQIVVLGWEQGWDRAALRLIAGGALLVALLDPHVVAQNLVSGPERVLIIEDDSASQRVAGRHASTTLIAERLAETASTEHVTRVVLRDGSAQHLADQVADAIGSSDVPLSGVVLLSDGRMPDMAQVIGTVPKNVPVSAVLTGPPVADIAIDVQQAQAFAMVGERAVATIRIVAEDRTTVPVSMTLPDGRIYREVVATGESVQVKLPIDRAGVNTFELRVTPAVSTEDITPVNNARLISVRGLRDRLRVLLISGEPHAGERAWRNVLGADPNLDLVHFTILRPVDKDDGTPLEELSLIAFPIRELFEEALPSFDLVIFDRYSQQGLLPPVYMAAIAQFVRTGGATLFAVGPEFADRQQSLFYSPLSAILPARPTGRALPREVMPELTDLGRRHPVTAPLPDLAGHSWGPWLRRLPAQAMQGYVLLDDAHVPGADSPLLVLDRVGRGRTALLLSDTIWLWQKGVAGGGPLDELLRRTVHWLMAEPDLEEERLSAEVSRGQGRVTYHTLADAPPGITMSLANGEVETIELFAAPNGSWQGEFRASEPGVVRIDSARGLRVQAEDADLAREITHLSPTTEVLGPTIASRNGCVIPYERSESVVFNNSEDCAAGLPLISRAIKLRSAEVSREPLIPVWGMLLLVVGALMGVWAREAR